MAARGETDSAANFSAGATRHRGRGLSAELVAILAVGVALAGVMLTMMMVMTDSFTRELAVVRDDVREIRNDVREVRDGQIDLRERMARLEVKVAQVEVKVAQVEAKVDVLVGDWPPKRNPGSVE